MYDNALDRLDKKRIPAHVAIIMDGNGRWATARGLDRSAGHVEGVATVRRITEIASEIGVDFLTLYTFSTENWNRPKEEVDALMDLIVTEIERETPDLIKNNVSLRMIGETKRMPKSTRERLEQCISDTSHCTGLKLVLAISYSARWDIVNAVQQIAEEYKNDEISLDKIDNNHFASKLSTAFMPDPDLLIRTGGDMRISNFLLWEIAYTELIFSPVYWPDFSKEDFIECIITFQQRQRRFGLTQQQINSNNSK